MKKSNIIFKNLVVIFFIAIVQSGIYGQPVNNKPISFTIEGTLTDIKDNATIWLGIVEPYESKGMAFKGDVKNGIFVISGQTFQNTIGHLSLFVHGPDGNPLKQYPETPKLWFLLCEGRSSVFISDSFNTNKIDCSCENEQKKFAAMRKELQTLYNEIQRKDVVQSQARIKGDTAAYVKASKEIKLLNGNKKSVLKSTILGNRNSFLSLALLKNYYPLSLPFAEAEPLFNKLGSRLKKTSMGMEIQRQFELEKNPATTLVGKKFKDFTAEDSLGNKIKISSFTGKWILLDFWASWCGPCREAHPQIKKLYSRFGNEKFEIVSVSIDKASDEKGRKRWLEAINEDKLNWPQLIDLADANKPGWYAKGFQLYKGNSIPLSFLISPEQTITDINLSVSELEERLKKLYESEINK